MKNCLVFIVVLFELVGLRCFAQQTLVDRWGKLSCNLIVEMVQDSYGFVWIGTENGLNRFDGWKFVSYFHDEKDPTSLSGNMVRKLLSDKEGRLWIGTNNGLQYYSPFEDAFHTIKFSDDIHPSVSDIIELHTGEIWIVTSGYGAFSIDTKTMKPTYLKWMTDLCSSLFMNCIYEDQSHDVWVAYVGNRLACISPDAKMLQTYLLPEAPSPKVYDIQEGGNGRLFISTHEHFLWKDSTHKDFIPAEYKGQTCVDARGMIKSSNGTLLVNSISYGLLYLDTLSMELHSIDSIPGALHKLVGEGEVAFMEDREGNLWTGSKRRGISIIPSVPFQFSFWDFSNDSPQGCISAIYKSRDGDVWIGNTDCTLYQLNQEGKMKNSFRTPKYVCAILQDSGGKFWLGTRYGGVLQFDEKTGNYNSFPLFKDKVVSEIIEGDDKIIYFALPGVGFAYYDLKNGGSRLITYTTKLSTNVRLGNDWINELLRDSEGLIWIGHGTGINCYDPRKNIFLDLPCDSILSSHVCYAMLEDNDQHIWMGTDNGIYSYDKVKHATRHYAREEGVPSNIICGLAADSEGNIWCSTYKGLCRIDRKNDRILNFFSGNGLVDKEYTTTVSYQDFEGHAYFGGLYGVTQFMPDSVRTPYQLHQPVLTQFYLNNTPINVKSLTSRHPVAETALMDLHNLYFTSDGNNFSLEFSTLEFHDCTNICFEYRISELDAKWSRTSLGENRITYNYLPPGDYIMEIRGCENEVYSPIRNISIHISPPWYLTIWAWGFYVLLFLGLLGGTYYTWYKRQCRKRREAVNEERLRFFINIAHEIRSPITLIISPLAELIKKDYDEVTMKSLKTMQRSANRILNLINQLLDIRRIDKGQMRITCCETDLTDFITDVVSLFDYQAAKRSIRFSFHHEADVLPVWIDCNNFDKVLMNLLMNAFKYTPDGGEIIVALTSGVDASKNVPLRHYAEISISDSGMGLDEKEIAKLFERFYQGSSTSSLGFGIGLNLAKMLVELHHGTIVAINRTDIKGSCFTVQLPLGNAHLTNEEMTETTNQPSSMLEIASDWELKEAKNSVQKSKTRHRLLLVDDDKEFCEYLQRELEGIYKVVVCHNGAEAVSVALQQRLNLIISDVAMPEMDGFELLKRLKTNANISHIPVILLTSQTETSNRMKGWEMGADAFLTKPFRIEELLLLCGNLIATRSLLKGKFGSGQELEGKIKAIEVKSNDEHLIERLVEVISRNLSESGFTVETLAMEVGVSRVQLHRKLKEIAGVSASEFIRNVRLKQAARLLKERKINISQIAYAVGFTNPNLFSTVFKNLYGCTPKEYSERNEEQIES